MNLILKRTIREIGHFHFKVRVGKGRGEDTDPLIFLMFS